MNTPPVLKAPALRRGDTVALVCPSSRPFDPGKIEQSRRWLEAEGFRVVVGANALKRYGNFAGTDDERLADFHAAWANPAVKALICERGGNGAPRLLPRLDYDLIRRNPKLLIGYSDITALHLAIHQQTGLITLHGSVAMDARATSYTYHQWMRTLTATEPLGAIPDPPTPEFPPPYPPYRQVIRPGSARGRLTGGNLTLIMETMGTPYEIETTGRILFLEDLNDEPHGYDAYFTQLRQAGKLQAAAAIIVGEDDVLFFLSGWSAGITDPSDVMNYLFFDGRDDTAYQNDQVDELLRQALTEYDEAARLVLYQQALELVAQDSPWIVSAYGKVYWLQKPYISNFNPGGGGSYTARLADVTVDASAM